MHVERKDIAVAAIVITAGIGSGLISLPMSGFIRNLDEYLIRSAISSTYLNPGDRFLKPDTLATGESRLDDAAARKVLVLESWSGK